MDKSNLLIDFSSPAQKLDLKPLIPVPPQTSLVPKEIVEPVDDPFEVPEICAPDPFENVLKCAISSDQSAEDTSQLCPQNKKEDMNNQIKSENSENQNSFKVENSEKNVKIVCSLSNDNVLKNVPLNHSKESSCNETTKYGKDDSQNSQNPLCTLVNNSDSDIMKNKSKCSVVLENKNQSQFSADFSTEESLKAIIAKRVNKCIRETLNGSLKTDKNVNNSVCTKPHQNKRSLSFIGLSTGTNKKECDRLNKSCTDVKDNINLENHEHNVSSDSSGFGLLSPDSSSTNASAEGAAEDQVFKEACRLSRTFSKLAESFRQGQEPDSDDDDLLSCKPRWLYTDSSEDEGEKLLKDPSLNFRRRSDSSPFSMPAPKSRNVLDSPALLAYKSQRSYTQLHDNTQEELKVKRSVSLVSQRKEVPLIPPHVVSVPMNFMKTDDQPIKLRKKSAGDMKKGPLRAVMPVHSMTKAPLLTVGKLPSKSDASPELRIVKTDYGLGTPNKDNSQLNITPMASSTPNKAESFQSNGNTSLLKPVASVVANKRRSLENNFGSHKSRVATPEGGAKSRSNSANSSIPRVVHVKPQPLRGLPLAPKSTSNLPRAAVAQPNAHVASVPEKKKPLPVKSSINPRVLSEVKTKSPRQSKVKSAVNTISSLVRGKKTAARDKENRVPV